MPEQAATYERRDVSVRVVTWFAIGLIVCAIIMHLVVAGLYKLFEHQHPSPDAPSRIAFHAQNRAPAPQLETTPQTDLAKYESAENAKLNSYGWIDKQAGVIRIPIERAMDLIAQRGLPTRGPGTQNSSGITPEQMQQQKAAATKP
ncbi:MAG: hypothetical protein JO354_02465 [Verrucomicrobia bacterium]|nr:hypothetical protein [Verrucomicrobiota bacterium]